MSFTTGTDSTTDSDDLIPNPNSEAIIDPPKQLEEVDDPTKDAFGYEKTEEEKAATPPPPVVDEKIENPATGYGKKPAEVIPPPTPPVTPTVVDTPPPPTTDEEKAALELKEIVKTLPDSVDKEKLEKFVTDNKLTKDQVTAYAALVKEEQTQFEAAAVKAKADQTAQFETELKADPDFGGENFERNLFQVEKLVANSMPNLKKALTEKGGVLPPYIMKDLLAISKALNPTTALVVGSPAGDGDKEENFLDEMYK